MQVFMKHSYYHCAFSTDLFHGQITQIYIDQLRGPEGIKCSPWKVFGITFKPSHFWAGEALDARTRGCLNITLSQKMTKWNFSNFCRKTFRGLTKSSCTFLYNFWSCNFQKSYGKTCILIQWVQKISFVKPGNFFLQKFEKFHYVIFGPM